MSEPGFLSIVQGFPASMPIGWRAPWSCRVGQWRRGRSVLVRRLIVGRGVGRLDSVRLSGRMSGRRPGASRRGR